MSVRNEHFARVRGCLNRSALRVSFRANGPRCFGVTIKDRLRRISRQRGVQYVLSVPERTVRSVAALTAGVMHEVAGVALPIGIRRGRLYRSLVDVTLRFL